MAKARDPATVAKKWSQNLQNAQAQMVAGVQAVTQAPTQLAAKQQAVMLARLQAAVNSGKWAAALNKVSLGDWQQSMISKGIPRVAQGAVDAEPKMETFMQKLLPYTANVSAQIKNMPNTTAADRKARMLANFDLMSQFKKN